MSISLRDRGVVVVLLDVEGTTTPISFVYDRLFPYARKHLRNTVRARVKSPPMVAIIATLRGERDTDVARRVEVPPWSEGSPRELTESVASYCEWLMDRDVKSPGLKQLQGLIWAAGYSSGELQGEVFPDVPAALQRWHDSEMMIAIYSSGSVLAQQLIFEHTRHGDLSGWMTAFFDTSSGSKTDSGSYEQIADRLLVTPDEILFVSDSPEELRAAEGAGVQPVFCVRPGNKAPVAAVAYASVSSLDEIA